MTASAPEPPDGDDAPRLASRRDFLRAACLGAALVLAPAILNGPHPAWCAAKQAKTPGLGLPLSDQDCSDGEPLSYTASPAGNAGTFILFSDVHFNPFADPATVAALAAAPAREWRAILSGSGPALAAYGQDTNDALFQSFLDDMAVFAPRPDFILFPGDLLCHRFWSLYPRLSGDVSQEGLLAFIAKTAAYFFGEVSRRFPGTPVYLAPGNNDSLEGDYQIAPKSPYFAATAGLAAGLAHKAGAPEGGLGDIYRQYGCYTAPLPGPGNGVIIVVNDIFWTKKSPHQEAGKPVLEFLEQELARAGQQGRKVWLMTHAPLGDNTYASERAFRKTGKDLYSPMLTDGFNGALTGLLARHAKTVRASFAGHVHRDAFRLVYPGDGGTPLSLMRIGPSISPITGNNPGYQVYGYDRGSLELLDMTTRYLDLGAAGPAWATEYGYARTYGRGLRSPKDWGEMHQGLLTCERRRQAFAANFDLRSKHINEVTERTFRIFWESLGLSAISPNALF